MQLSGPFLQLVLICLVIFSCATGQAADAVIINESFSSLSVGDRLEWLEDREGSLSIGQVSSPAFSMRFKPSPGRNPNFGYTTSIYWFRFEVKNPGEKSMKWFLKISYPQLNNIDFYVNRDNTFLQLKSGNNVHYSRRPYQNENLVFPVRQNPGKVTCYLRVSSLDSAVFLPASIWREKTLLKSFAQENSINGFFYGILLVMLVFNFVIFLFMREKIYLYYVIYIIGVAAMILALDGLGNRFLWKDFPFLNKSYFQIFFVNVMIIIFSKSFLDSPRRLPVMNKIMSGNVILLFISALLYFFVPDHMPYLAVFMTIITSVISLAAGIILLVRGERTALFYVCSWSFLLMGGSSRGLMGMNVLPFHYFNETVLKASISLQIVTFAIALADRINLMRRELMEKYSEAETSRQKLHEKNMEMEAVNEELAATGEEFEAQNEELISSQQDLARSEELFRKIFETSPYGIVINSGIDGRYLMVNDAFCRDRETPREEIIGKDSYELGTAMSREYIRTVEKELREKGRVDKYTTKGKNKNGEEYYTLYSAVVTEFNGEPAILSITINITEQVKLQQQLQQTQKMDIVGQLAGGIAHDFNNMLGGILGSADMLDRKLGSDPKAGKYIKTIKESAGRAGDLIKKLLVFSRNRETEKEIIDIHTCLGEAISLLERSIDRKIEIRIDRGAEKSAVEGDTTLLQNVFLNIGVNARDAMPDGGRLSFRTENVSLEEGFCRNFLNPPRPGEFIRIDISDTGNGIPEEIRDYIFDPFFTTKEKEKGTGLGLAMVYNTVGEHGGGIFYESRPGEGTLFTVYLPLSNQEVREKIEAEEVVQAGEGMLLVIDDEKMMRETVSEMLESLGYTVLQASDGKMGIELFEKEHGKVLLVLLDQVMPKLSGRDTFLELKKYNSEVKVLFTSGYSEDRYREELKNLGASGFIQKPYELLSLSRHVSRIIKGGKGKQKKP